MADIEKTIEELKRTEQFLTEYGFDGHIQQVHDAIELLKEYMKHLQNDLETLKEEKMRLEFEHETKAFIYKEKGGLINIKIKGNFA